MNRSLQHRRPIPHFLPQPLPAAPDPRIAGYIPPMATVEADKKRKPSHCTGVRLAQARETFWDYVGQEAVQRAGRGAQLKGVIHEVAIREQRNLTPDALLRGNRTSLTRSATAKTVDLITTRNGRVVERLQVKDCISDSCARNVQGRVSSGQYRTARLVGTQETVEKFRGVGVTKRAESSGISSRSTTRAADNAGAKVPNKNLLVNNALDIAGCVGTASVTDAALAGGAVVIGSLRELRHGRIDGAEYAERVVLAGATAGFDTAVRTTIALGTKEAAKAAARSMGAAGLKRFAGSNPGTAVAFGVAEQLVITIQLACGEIDDREYGVRSVQNAGSTGGAIGGAVAGAAIGSAIPVVGTVVGGVIGGIAGAIGGGGLARELGTLLFGPNRVDDAIRDFENHLDASLQRLDDAIRRLESCR